MDMPTQRSQANLRTALWRIRQSGPALVSVDCRTVTLGEALSIDIENVLSKSRSLLGDEAGDDLVARDVELFRYDLLPGWDEDWITLERERIRQVRLHALEALCRRLTATGRYAEAIEAGQEAVAGEPLRESAHTVLITAYIEEGNLVEAVREFNYYEAMLEKELGAAPSTAMRALLRPVATTSSRSDVGAVQA
jgi:DNA-binding SARP family transcriptional activator